MIIDVSLNVLCSDDELLDFRTLNVYPEDNLVTRAEIEDYDLYFYT